MSEDESWKDLTKDGLLYKLLLRWFEEPLNREDARSAADTAMSAVMYQQKRLNESWMDTAQPVAPAPDTAAVLRELLDKIEEMQHTDWAINCDGPLFRRARAALAATSGARAAAGGAVRVTDGVVALHRPDPVRNPWHCYNTYDGSFIECRTDQDVAGYHVLPAAPPTPAAPGVAGYVLGTCFRDTQGNPHREGWSGDWYATKERAYEELAKWPGDQDHEAAVFEVRLAYDPHQHVWCPTCGDYPGGRCTDHTGRVCCITHRTRLVPLAPEGADGEGEGT